MTALTSPPLAVRTAARDRNTVAIAWVGTLALSYLPTIVLVEALGVDRTPLRWLPLGAGLALVALATRWRPARPLRGYFITMLVVIAATELARPLLTGWTHLIEGPQVVRAMAVAAVFAALAIGVGGFLVFVLGQRPSDVYLTLGDLRAPSAVRLPGMRRSLRWTVVGTFAALVLSVGFATQLWMGSVFTPDGVARFVGLAFVVLTAAVCNAFAEEVVFRAGPLAFLHRIVAPARRCC